MPLRNSADGYGSVARLFHWLTVLAVLTAWILPQISDILENIGLNAWLSVHIAAGLLVLPLLFGRLIWRVVDTRPAPIESPLGIWGERAALAGHAVLYLLLLAIPITGILVQFTRGRDVPVFGLFQIASPWAQDRALSRSVRGIHELLADAVLIVAALHAAAALVHHFIFRDAVLMRMLRGHSENRPAASPDREPNLRRL